MTIWKVQLVYKNFDFFLVTLETIYITSRNPEGLSNLTLTIFLICHISNYNSQSHHYAQLGNALQKHVFAYSALIIGYFKKFHRPILYLQCPEVTILQGVCMDPICPNLPIRSKINVNKKNWCTPHLKDNSLIIIFH